MAAPAMWRVRGEDDTGPGRAISLERLGRGIENGVWGESDQVRKEHDKTWSLIGERPELEEFLPATNLFSAKTLEEAEMDMTPMIDVTFQLLIFFMIAATYVVQKSLEMPKVDNEDAPPTKSLAQLEENNIIIKVLRDQSVEVSGKPTPMESLVSALTEEARAGSKSEVVIDADDEVHHETIVRVIDAAGGAQIEKVHFVSRPGGKPPP